MQTEVTEDNHIRCFSLRPKGTYCAALWCNNNFGANPSLSLFRIPKDEQRAIQWLSNAGRKDLVERGAKFWHTKYLCEKHFSDRMFMNEKRKKLVWNATPTIFPQPSKTVYKARIKDTSNEPSQQDDKKMRKILPKPVSLIHSSEMPLEVMLNVADTFIDEQSAASCPSTVVPGSKRDNPMSDPTSKVLFMEPAGTNERDRFSPNQPDGRDINCETDNFHLDFNCEEPGEKMYPCTSCGEMFLFKSSLLAHEKTYHPELSFSCVTCGKIVSHSRNEFINHECDCNVSKM